MSTFDIFNDFFFFAPFSVPNYLEILRIKYKFLRDGF